MNIVWFRTKVILINCGIAAGLIYRYWTGTPLLLIVVIGVALFVLANVLMIIAQKQSARNN
jgi:uncharacterized membrane protein